MADDPQTPDPAKVALDAIVAAVKHASEQDATPVTDLKVLVGLLETAAAIAVFLDMPVEVLEMLMNVSLVHAEAVCAREQAKRAAVPVAAAPPTPDRAVQTPVAATLTPDQMREILLRLKEGGRAH